MLSIIYVLFLEARANGGSIPAAIGASAHCLSSRHRWPSAVQEEIGEGRPGRSSMDRVPSWRALLQRNKRGDLIHIFLYTVAVIRFTEPWKAFSLAFDSLGTIGEPSVRADNCWVLNCPNLVTYFWRWLQGKETTDVSHKEK